MREKGIHLVPTLCTLYSVLELGETLGLGQKQRDEMDVNRGPWLASLKLARDVGVKIAAGGDIGNRYRHGENAKEIVLLAENGFTPMEALQAATSVAADAVGLGNRVGAAHRGLLGGPGARRGPPAPGPQGPARSGTDRAGNGGGPLAEGRARSAWIR